MIGIWTYISEALQGVERYFGANKLITVLFGVLLAAWLMKLAVDSKGNRLLNYTVVLSILALCPVTAPVIMQYQTRFYDYEWAWSMVPATAVIAYVCTILYGQIVEKRKRVTIAIAALAILILCGNQGAFQTADKEAAAEKKAVSEIVQYMERETDMEQAVVWAPKNIMQELRRRNGEILLVYGRDMWDGKSGAYDYEAYSEEIIEAYEWLNIVLEEMKVAEPFDDPLYVLETISLENQLYVQARESILTVIDEGANTIILPNLAAECYGDVIKEMVEQKNMTPEIAYTEGYTIFLLR